MNPECYLQAICLHPLFILPFPLHLLFKPCALESIHFFLAPSSCFPIVQDTTREHYETSHPHHKHGKNYDDLVSTSNLLLFTRKYAAVPPFRGCFALLPVIGCSRGPEKVAVLSATSLHGARLTLSCWQHLFSPVFERTAPYFFVPGYSLPRSVMKGFWVALLIAAQLVVNASTMAAEKGTMNHHGIPPLLLIK